MADMQCICFRMTEHGLSHAPITVKAATGDNRVVVLVPLGDAPLADYVAELRVIADRLEAFAKHGAYPAGEVPHGVRPS